MQRSTFAYLDNFVFLNFSMVPTQAVPAGFEAVAFFYPFLNDPQATSSVNHIYKLFFHCFLFIFEEEIIFDGFHGESI